MPRYRIVHFLNTGEGPIGFNVEPPLPDHTRIEFERLIDREMRGQLFDSPEAMHAELQRLLDRLSQ